MTITIKEPELEASLEKAAAASNATVDEYAALLLSQALVPLPASEDVLDKPLRGSVLHYDNPFEPVALDDWEALT